MAFLKYGTLNSNAGDFVLGGNVNATPMPTIIANSGGVRVGDTVVFNTTGFIARATNAGGQCPAGIVIGVASANGVAVTPDSATTDTWTVAADNQTVGQIYAILDASPFSIWSAAIVGTIGTTAASGRPGAWINLNGTAAADAGRLAETSATRTATTQGQFLILGTNPNDSTRLLVKLNNTIFDNAVQI